MPLAKGENKANSMSRGLDYRRTASRGTLLKKEKLAALARNFDHKCAVEARLAKTLVANVRCHRRAGFGVYCASYLV